MTSTVLDWRSSFPVKEESTVYKATLAEKATFAISSAVIASNILGGGTAFAQANNVIPNAFEPVKNLLISMAEPLCYVMFVWGCIEVICKRPASGLDRMKYAAIGFIGINLIPVIMDTIKAAAPQ